MEVLGAVGLEGAEITRRFDTFDGTSKENVAHKFGVIGVNFTASKPVGERPPAGKVLRDVLAPVLSGLRSFFSWRDVEAIQLEAGRPAPDFSLPVAGDGEPFQLSAERGRFILLFFLPGDWCPVCQMHMRIYKKEIDLLTKHDVKLVVVSPAYSDGAEAFAKGVGIEHALIVDETQGVARAYGAVRSYEKDRTVALPMSFLIDPEGMVRSASELDDVSFGEGSTKFVEVLRGVTPSP